MSASRSNLKQYCKFKSESFDDSDGEYRYGFIIGEASLNSKGDVGSGYLVAECDFDDRSVNLYHTIKTWHAWLAEIRQKHTGITITSDHVELPTSATVHCHIMGSDKVTIIPCDKLTFEEYETFLAETAARVEVLKDVYYPSLIVGQKLRVLPPTVYKTTEVEIAYIINNPELLGALRVQGDFALVCKSLDTDKDILEHADKGAKLHLAIAEKLKEATIALNDHPEHDKIRKEEIKDAITSLKILNKATPIMFPDLEAYYYIWHSDQMVCKITAKEMFLIS